MQYWIRKLFTISLVSTYFVAFTVMAAESLVGFSSNPNAIQPTVGQFAQPTAANDFKSKVKSLGQKNRNELTQQFKQELSQQQQPTAQPQTATTTTAPVSATSTTPASPQPVPGVTPEMPASASTTPADNLSTFSSSAPGASPPAPTTVETQVPPPPSGQGEVYTGFGAGTGAAPTSPSSGQTSGGWNIKY